MASQGRREKRSQLQHMDKAIFPGLPPSFWLTVFWQLSGSFHGRQVVPRPRKHPGSASHCPSTEMMSQCVNTMCTPMEDSPTFQTAVTSNEIYPQHGQHPQLWFQER